MWRLVLAACVTFVVGCDRAAEVTGTSPPSSGDAREVAPPVSAPPSGAVSARAPTAPDCPEDYTCGADDASAPIDLLLVEKSKHRLHLVSKTRVVGSYAVALGSGGLGQKGYEGDKTTPHGRYAITHVIRGTRWHTYLALDFPNEEDVRRYERRRALGEVPNVGAGSGIAIHGRRADMPDKLHKLADWTLGCVALDNDEIDAVAARVSKGTPVEIRP